MKFAAVATLAAALGAAGAATGAVSGGREVANFAAAGAFFGAGSRVAGAPGVAFVASTASPTRAVFAGRSPSSAAAWAPEAACAEAACAAGACAAALAPLPLLAPAAAGSAAFRFGAPAPLTSMVLAAGAEAAAGAAGAAGLAAAA